MKNRKITGNIGFGAKVLFKTQILNKDGSVARERDWDHNLVLDIGLDMMCRNKFASLNEVCEVGTSTIPTERDSGSITFTQIGDTITASGAFFESADVGRLFKYDTGEEYYITAFTDDQNITVDTSAAHAAAEATVYYVNQTGLQSPSRVTENKVTGSGNCGTSHANGVVEHKRTFLFPAETAEVTYNEIGWGPKYDSNNTDGGSSTNRSGLGSARFGRAIIAGGDTLQADQQYKVAVRVQVAFSPVTQTPVADVGNNGFDTTGDHIIGQLVTAIGQGDANSYVDSNGYTQGTARMEPMYTPILAMMANTAVLPTEPASGNVSYPDLNYYTMTRGNYTEGNHYREHTKVYAPNEANSSAIRGFMLGQNYSYDFYGHYLLKFDADQEKLDTHRLTVTFRWTVSRQLSN